MTLDFLAGGGDNYPFPTLGTDRVDLTGVLTDPEDFSFAAPGSEQDALAEFLGHNHPVGGGTPFDVAETDPAGDERIQNLNERDDSVPNELIPGTAGNDRIAGTDANSTINGLAGNDRIDAGGGNNVVDGGPGNDRIESGDGDDMIRGGNGNDRIQTGDGNDIVDDGNGNDRVDTGDGNDILIVGNGNNRIDGGPGFDAALNGGNADPDDLTRNPDGSFTVRANGGTTRLTGVETVSFGNVVLNLTGRADGLTGAEINAYDPDTQQLFVTAGSTVQVLDISDPTNPGLTNTIDVAGDVETGRFMVDGVTSVAVSNGLVAVAVTADPVTDPGKVAFYDADGTFLGEVTVGSPDSALPDMVTFTPDGMHVLVANEGEPDNGVDPEGSISIIDVSGGVAGATVTNLDFQDFNGQEDALRAEGVRIFPGTSVADDMEPEYIAVSSDGSTAFVALQENNAFAVVDLVTQEITDILPLGLKDHSLAGNALDASDQDGAINIQNWPVFGMYMPDGIASYAVNGDIYYVTANEGDARNEDMRVSELTLDPTAFPNAAVLQQDENLGRLEVSSIDGETTPGSGVYDQLFSYGARSFSIFDDEGNLVFDSGDDFENIVASQLDPDFFNDQGVAGDFDSRSDNKGPEPEGVAVGQVGDDTYAFIGLERVGGIMAYDITDPTAPEFVQYINTRDLGDVGPEGLTFIAAEDSPTDTPLLAVSFEESNTVAVYDIFQV